MLGSTAGIGCEYGISTAINDEGVKGNVGEVSIKRIVVDGVLSGGTAFIPGGTAAIGTAGKEAAKQVASSAFKTGLVTGVFTYVVSQGGLVISANRTQWHAGHVQRPTQT
jgi:hypothetical protein